MSDTNSNKQIKHFGNNVRVVEESTPEGTTYSVDMLVGSRWIDYLQLGYICGKPTILSSTSLNRVVFEHGVEMMSAQMYAMSQFKGEESVMDKDKVFDTLSNYEALEDKCEEVLTEINDCHPIPDYDYLYRYTVGTEGVSVEGELFARGECVNVSFEFPLEIVYDEQAKDKYLSRRKDNKPLREVVFTDMELQVASRYKNKNRSLTGEE